MEGKSVVECWQAFIGYQYNWLNGLNVVDRMNKSLMGTVNGMDYDK